MNSLPASRIAGEVLSRLAIDPTLVITAPPGAGKSTLLPLAIASGVEGRVLMLEPRRIAARQIAERMSSLLGEKVGQTVGYRIRFESCISDHTRVEVLTEGILTRMLLEDPTLDGVSAVIFDEFHERSLACDEALALTRESQQLVRPDLRLVIMSATIDTSSICEMLDAPSVSSEGRMFPVEVKYLPTDDGNAPNVAGAVLRACRDHEGDVLAFLPGEAEIRRCAELLADCPARVYPLFGMMPFEQQRAAIAPSAPGERKVVLATPVAETSLTIEGVRVVVDSGLCRRMVYDAQTGLSRLETVRISLDMAAQRTGRAGRVAPGVCYRLWNPAVERQMSASRTPEILTADLAPLVLDLAAWGEANPERLSWLTPPPKASLMQARGVLCSLGALSDSGITPLGRRMAALPCHPRIARMMLSAPNPSLKALAADIAAVLEDRDPLPQEGSADLTLRIERLRRERSTGRPSGPWARIARASEQYCRLCHVRCEDSIPDAYAVGALVAFAFPERIAKADETGHFTLSGGGRAMLASGPSLRGDDLAACEWLAVASLNAPKGVEGSIFLAAPFDPEDVGELIRERDRIAWDTHEGRVVARRERFIGGLWVSSRPLSDIPKEMLTGIILDAVRREGLSMLDFNDEVQNLQRRVAAVASWHPELELPDLSTQALLEHPEDWLEPFIGRASSVSDLKKIDLCQAMWTLLEYSQQQEVDRLAPTHIAVPTGSRIRLEYRLGAEAPVLKVRLQECFGLLDTPCVDDGRRPVLMELLSPGFKPVQLTSDLRSFWSDTYFEVRKELRRRYPKHSWPDDPLAAPAVRGPKRSK